MPWVAPRPFAAAFRSRATPISRWRQPLAFRLALVAVDDPTARMVMFAFLPKRRDVPNFGITPQE